MERNGSQGGLLKIERIGSQGGGVLLIERNGSQGGLL